MLLLVPCASCQQLSVVGFFNLLDTLQAGSERNYSKLTFDGVDLMGERLAEEVSFVSIVKLYAYGFQSKNFVLMISKFQKASTSHFK